MRNPLLDQEFLRKLDLVRDKVTYAKIILLTFNEEPVYEIQGKITGGSVNIDGASAVRRTCSLTMISPDVDITNTYWALKNKFKLEVGVENTINSQYPEIIWFKQGTFVFTGLNMNVQSNNFTISINGKDKMCLLNGEVGGSINASTDFGKLEEYRTLSNNEIIRDIISIPIVDIIKNAVHVHAGEPLHNIILNDIDNYGLELLKYRGSTPMFMLRETNGEISNITFSIKYQGYDSEGKSKEYIFDDNFKYYNLTSQVSNKEAEIVYAMVQNELKEYNVVKIDYDMTVGYRKTDLIYPGELVAAVGESLVSILDKIKNMFSDFEYFYDIDGRFIFQKKKTYINTSWNNLTKDGNEIYAEDALHTSSTAYSFEEGILLSAFTDTPQILNIRNDFSIWGKRESASGAEIPVHMRYAIDFKPEYYKPLRFNETTGEQLLDIEPLIASDSLDWRELIYQMALDYFKYNHKKDNFTQLVAAANSNHYPTGITGYETYYTDMQGFWRQLYNPEAIDLTIEKETWVEKDIIKGVSTGLFSSKTGWNKNVTEAPELLNFWFDLISVDGEMGKYAISAIGNRPKAINDDKVTAIYFQETPTVLFIKDSDTSINYPDFSGYTFIKITPQMENYFTISAQGKSAQDELDSLLYQHTYATEAVTLTSVPIYHLQPNTRIFVKDKNTGINGEYIVSKITIPLQYNGTTSITTTKAVERIY